MPDGVFSHLHDNSFNAGKNLVSHKDVKAVAFTGSYTGGKALFDLASKREVPIPVFAEMGSINPVFLLPGAMKNRINEVASAYASSITLGTGQFCTNPGLLVGLKSEELSSFSESLDEKLQEIVNEPMLNKGIFKNFEKLKSIASSQSGLEIISSSRASGSSLMNQPETLIASVDSEIFINNPTLHEEVFGPYSLIVKCSNDTEMLSVAEGLRGQLTITVMAADEDLEKYQVLISRLKEKAGRLIFNGVPTGVEVCSSMHHGGPYPATTDSRFTSVGTGAIKRFVRPLSFQNWPNSALPEELKNGNPQNIWRLVNNNWTKSAVQ